MKKTFKEIMTMLGVPKVLGPYETWPWSHYDEDTQSSISAEVRMGTEDTSVEAEIQIIREEPKEGEAPFECLLWLEVEEKKPGEWRTISVTVRGEPYGSDVYNWEERALKVFLRCTALLNQSIMPDFDQILEEEFKAKDRYGDKGGSGSSKQPIIRPEALLDIKRGGSF